MHRKGLSALGIVASATVTIIIIVLLFFIIKKIPSVILPWTSCEDRGGGCFTSCTELKGGTYIIEPSLSSSCKKEQPGTVCCVPKPGTNTSPINHTSKKPPSSEQSSENETQTQQSPSTLDVYFGDPTSPTNRIFDGKTLRLDSTTGKEPAFTIRITNAQPSSKLIVIHLLGDQELDRKTYTAGTTKTTWNIDHKIPPSQLYSFENTKTRIEFIFLKDGEGPYKPAEDRVVRAYLVVKTPIQLVGGSNKWSQRETFTLTCPSQAGCTKYQSALVCQDKSRVECLQAIAKQPNPASLSAVFRDATAISEERPVQGERTDITVTNDTKGTFLAVKVTTKQQDGQEQAIILLSKNPIFIDTNPPYVFTEFDGLQQRLAITCQDDESGCVQEYTYAYLDNIKDFASSIVKGVIGKEASIHCPDPTKDANYPLTTRQTYIDYRFDDVRVICVRGKDRAGNVDVSPQILYSTADLLEGALASLT